MIYKEITRQQLSTGYAVIVSPTLGDVVRYGPSPDPEMIKYENRKFTVVCKLPTGNYLVVDPEFEAEQERARLREEGLIPSFYSYAPGIMTTKFDMELLGTDWNPPMERTVCIVVRNAGAECSFSAYVASANRVFEAYDVSRTRCV